MAVDSYLGQLWITMGVDYSGLAKAEIAMKNFQSAVTASAAKSGVSLNAAANSLYRFGSLATFAFTAPLAAMTVMSTKMYAQVEQINQKTVALANTSQEQMDAWQTSIRRIGAATNQTAKDISQSLYYVASAGIESSKAIEITDLAAKGAVVGLGDMSTIARLLTYAQNAYGKEALSSARYMDMLTVAVREGTAEAGEMVGVIGDILPVAAQMGVGFDQVVGTLAAMTRTGFNAHKAATSLRQILVSLLDPASESNKALEMASRKFNDASLSADGLRKTIREKGLIEALLKIQQVAGVLGESFSGVVFGNIRALTGNLSLVGKNVDAVREILRKTKTEIGAFDTALSIMTKTTEMQFKDVKKAIEQAFLDLGKNLLPTVLPILRGVTEVIQNLSDWFRNLSYGSQQWVTALGLALAAIGPFTIAMSGLLRFFTIMGFILPGVVVGIHAVGAALIFLSEIMIALPGAQEAIGIMVLAGALLSVYNANVALTKSQQDLVDAETASLRMVQEETRQIEQLMIVAQSEYASREEKLKAIKTINKIAPEYLSYITEETIRTGEARDMINSYTDALMKKYRLENLIKGKVKNEQDYMESMITGKNKDLDFMQKVDVYFIQHIVGNPWEREKMYQEANAKARAEAHKVEQANYDKAIEKAGDELKVVKLITAEQRKWMNPPSLPLAWKGPLDATNTPWKKEYLDKKAYGDYDKQPWLVDKTKKVPEVPKPAFNKELEQEVQKILTKYKEEMQSVESRTKLFGSTISATGEYFDAFAEKNKITTNTLEELSKILSITSPEVQRFFKLWLQYNDVNGLTIATLKETSLQINEIDNKIRMYGGSYSGLADKISVYEGALDKLSKAENISVENINELLNTIRALTDELTKETLQDALLNIGISAEVIGRSFDTLDAQIKAHTDAMNAYITASVNYAKSGKTQESLAESNKAKTESNTVALLSLTKALQEYGDAAELANIKQKYLGDSFDATDAKIQANIEYLNKLYTMLRTAPNAEASKKISTEIDNATVVDEILREQKAKETYEKSAQKNIDRRNEGGKNFNYQRAEILSTLEYYKTMRDIHQKGSADWIKYNEEFNKLGGENVLQQQMTQWTKFANHVEEVMRHVGSVAQGFIGVWMDMINIQQQKAYKLIDDTAKREGKSAEWVAKKKEEIDKIYGNKKKQAAIAEAIVNTAVAVSAALKTPWLIPFVLALGAAQIAVIRSTPMAKGGVVPAGYPNDTYPARLTSGEIVVPPGQLKNLQGANSMMTIHLIGKMTADGRELVYTFDEQMKVNKSY